jgi:hypothetical protein
MRINQIITEAKIDSDLIDRYTRSGYDFISTGSDQAAFIHPKTGWVIKIFGTLDSNATALKLTKGQRSLLDFAKYCAANPNNPFLPRFKNPKLFKFKNEPYLKITMERLFPLYKSDADTDRGVALAIIADTVRENPSDNPLDILRYVISFADERSDKVRQAYYELLSYLGKSGFVQLVKTIRDLNNIARVNGYLLDLHFRNFMYSSDGDIVIADPFHVIE